MLAEIEKLPVKSWAVSTDIASYQRTLELTADSANVLTTFGIHPWEAHRFAHRLEELEPLIAQSPHLGELGLDFHWVKERSRYSLQRQLLIFFLERAYQQQKIVNLHTKGAESEIADLLEAHHIERGIIHWYSGPADVLKRLVACGYYFTFGVELLYSEKIAALAKMVPLEQILTETDGPTALAWLTNDLERSMPHHIKPLLSKLAKLKELSPEACGSVILQNWSTLLSNNA